jgi:hypothetical protein
VLQVGAIAFAIAQQHHLGTLRQQLLHLLDQGDVPVFGKVPLLPVAHPPRQRAGSALRDHMHHHRHTATPHDAAIHDEHQRLDGQLSQ